MLPEAVNLAHSLVGWVVVEGHLRLRCWHGLTTTPVAEMSKLSVTLRMTGGGHGFCLSLGVLGSQLHIRIGRD